MHNMAVVLIAIGLSCCIGGVLAYAGKWKKWAYPSGFTSCGGFALLFLGVLLVLLGVALLLPTGWAAGKDITLLTIAFAAVGVVGSLGFFGLWPNFMLPKWFREGRELRRQAERAA